MSTQTIDSKATSPPAESHATRQACPVCQIELPIYAPRRGDPAAEWICESCGGATTGVLIPECANTLGRRVRFGPKVFDTKRSEPIPRALRELVARFVIRRRLKQDTHERRRNPRVPCDLDAVVVGLNTLWLPCREPICAVVIDLAAHGLGMMTAECVREARFAIQIECTAGTVQLLCQRAWSNFVGDSFQNTGVEFVARLGETSLGAGVEQESSGAVE